jgi:predicted Rossmann fold flavoprotein
MMKVGIIGGGAAGFYAAIHVKINYPDAEVTILEKTTKILSKVKVSGGGRCNVTNACKSIPELARAYPRGSKFLKKAFQEYYTVDTMQFFEERNVPLVTQEDQCIFPVSQSSQTIIDCFLDEVRQNDIKVLTKMSVTSMEIKDNGIKLVFAKSEVEPIFFDKVIVATGGSPKRCGLEWLEKLGHKIEDPVPSLFTFNMPEEKIKELMGVVIDPVQVSITGTKLKSSGPLLITHWGMSGPAILKLSAFGARILADTDYSFTIHVNWVNESDQNLVQENICEIVSKYPKKQLSSFKPYALRERLWLHLLEKIGLESTRKWSDIGKKGINKIVNILSHDVYTVKGKTTFKEEFVTCGGVSLQSIHHKSMRSKVSDHLYFAGEIMDIDGITGGYNFQSAWTTAYIAAQLR